MSLASDKDRYHTIPCDYCLGKFSFISHRLVNIWKNWVSWKAKPVDTESKRNATPMHQWTSVMESNSITCPNNKHTDSNQSGSKYPSSCRIIRNDPVSECKIGLKITKMLQPNEFSWVCWTWEIGDYTKILQPNSREND